MFCKHIKYNLSNMLKIKTGHLSTRFQNRSPPFLSNLHNFHSLEVVDRVSETQLQVGENFSS